MLPLHNEQLDGEGITLLEGMLQLVQDCPEGDHAQIDNIIKEMMKSITIHSTKSDMKPILDAAVYNALVGNTGMILLETIQIILPENSVE